MKKPQSHESIAVRLERAWYEQPAWLLLLRPFSWVYRCIAFIRRKLYALGVKKRNTFPIPVVVVGNIIAGGSGKTPFVIALAKQFSEKGFRVGIISRGYQSKNHDFPRNVREYSWEDVGDEPALIASQTDAVIVVDANRVRGIKSLIVDHDCDLVLSDDGLQHYRINPTVTIALHPGSRLKRNLPCIPAGPLREPESRLSAFDFVVDPSQDGFALQLSLQTKDDVDAAQALANEPFTVVAGIARPERLLHALDHAGLHYKKHLFPDHHAFVKADFDGIEGPILMTEKDWVKCKSFDLPNTVVIAKVAQSMPQSFLSALYAKIVPHRQG